MFCTGKQRFSAPQQSQWYRDHEGKKECGLSEKETWLHTLYSHKRKGGDKSWNLRCGLNNGEEWECVWRAERARRKGRRGGGSENHYYYRYYWGASENHSAARFRVTLLQQQLHFRLMKASILFLLRAVCSCFAMLTSVNRSHPAF